MQELLSKANKASKAFEAKHGRDPTAEELAPQLGVDASRIKDAWEAVTSPRSLDQPMGDADGGTLGDVVEVRGGHRCAWVVAPRDRGELRGRHWCEG
jgi:RNA polymerase primary sigma factor